MRPVTTVITRPASWLIVGFFFAQSTLATAAPPKEPISGSRPAARPGSLSRENIASSSDDFRRCLEAAREVEAARRGYAEGTVTLAALLKSQQALTAAQIKYSTTATNVRGNPALRDYLARRGEVAALTRGLSEARHLLGEVPSNEQEQVRQEVTRYIEALKLAQQELAQAEKAWKTADRAKQFRYLNRRALSPR